MRRGCSVDRGDRVNDLWVRVHRLHVRAVNHGLLRVHIPCGRHWRHWCHLRGHLRCHLVGLRALIRKLRNHGWCLRLREGRYGGLLELSLCAVAPTRSDFASLAQVVLENDNQSCRHQMRGQAIMRKNLHVGEYETNA